MWNHRVVSRASAEAVSLMEAKLHLDVDYDDDDMIINSYLSQSIRWVENHTGLYLAPALVEARADSLPSGPLELDFPGIDSVTSVIVDGVAVSAYSDLGGSPYTLLAPEATGWPRAAQRLGVVVAYTAGFPEGSLDEGLKAGVMGVLEILYNKPTGPELKAQWNAVKMMLETYRVRNI